MYSCHHAFVQPELKRVGQSGQISVGRELAGKLIASGEVTVAR
jgi:hypothetical protein